MDDIIKTWNLKRDTSPAKTSYAPERNGNQEAINRLMSCKFFSKCREHPEDVPEPLWYSLISNAICVRPGGVTLCHELSRGHEKYSRSETDVKILQALDASGPHTCAYINSHGFKCEMKCGVKAPAALLFNGRNYQTGDPVNDEQQLIRISFG